MGVSVVQLFTSDPWLKVFVFTLMANNCDTTLFYLRWLISLSGEVALRSIRDVIIVRIFSSGRTRESDALPAAVRGIVIKMPLGTPEVR